MLLRNYDVIQTISQLPYLTDKTNYTASGYGDGFLCFKTSEGSIYQVARYTSAPISIPALISLSNSANGYSANSLLVGSGITPVTYDDYCLENVLTTSQVQNLSHKTSEVVYSEDSNTFSTTYYKTFLALTDVIVSEIGIMSPNINMKTGGASKTCLIYRKVLDTPIEVSANSNFVVSFTTTVSANPNKPTDYQASVSVE